MPTNKPHKIDDTMPLRLGLLTAIIIFGGIGVWSVNTTISGAVIAHGRLEPTISPHLISHPIGGIIGHIFVSEGQYVQVGDILVEMDTAGISIELKSVTDMLTNLLARRIRLRAERDGSVTMLPNEGIPDIISELPGLEIRISEQELVFEERQQRLTRRIKLQRQRTRQLEVQIEGLVVQISSTQSEIEVINSEYLRYNSLLDHGLAQQAVVSSIERDLYGKTGELALMNARLGEIQIKIEEYRLAEILISDVYRSEAQVEIDRIGPDILANIANRNDLLFERQMLEVRAQISGKIHEIRILGEGFVLRAGAPILTIIPNEGHLQAVVRVNSQDIDQVYSNQTVNLRFRAFNARALPTLSGQIDIIAADVKLDTLTKKYFFEVTIQIPEIYSEDLIDKSIVNGMEITAFIQTEQESPLEYVTRPVLRYLNLTFRDR